MSQWSISDANSWKKILCASYPFQIVLWAEYQSPETDEQPVAGQIIPIDMTEVGPAEAPVPGIVTVFTRP